MDPTGEKRLKGREKTAESASSHVRSLTGCPHEARPLGDARLFLGGYQYREHSEEGQGCGEGVRQIPHSARRLASPEDRPQTYPRHNGKRKPQQSPGKKKPGKVRDWRVNRESKAREERDRQGSGRRHPSESRFTEENLATR